MTSCGFGRRVLWGARQISWRYSVFECHHLEVARQPEPCQEKVWHITPIKPQICSFYISVRIRVRTDYTNRADQTDETQDGI